MTRFSILLFFICQSFLSKAQLNHFDTLVSVGEHRLHFQIIRGEGTPILFEAGNGDDGIVWKDILMPIYEQTGATLITYDRAGLGQSEIDTTSISFENEAADLMRALELLGFDKGLLIVSHSFGGFYTTWFARQYPDKVKGAVMIDIALPCFFTESWSFDFIENIGDNDWTMIKKYKPGLYYVLKDLDQIAAKMAEITFPSDIPATLIAAETPPAMVKEEEKAHWKECLASFGNQPQHTYLMAEDSEHKVWQQRPEFVIEEISKLHHAISP